MPTRIFLILLLSSGASGCPYAQNLFISVPKLEALSGSCLLIPCTFKPAPEYEYLLDLTKPVEAIWSKTYPYLGNPIIPMFFHSARTSLTSPMEMVGNLNQKNCTTLFSNINTSHSDTYYFRIENHKFKATGLCESSLQINVRESPWSPKVQVDGTQREQETVTITCSALTPCPNSPPQLTWNLQPKPPQNVSQNSDGTFITSIQHKMTLSEKQHGLEVRCSAAYPVTGGQKRAEGAVSLNVQYSPKNTNVLLSVITSLPVGQAVNLNCSSSAWPPVHSFSWFRVSSQGQQRVHEGQVYNFILNETTQGEYFCQAKNQIGEQNSPAIKVHGAEDKPPLPWKPIVGAGVGLLTLICVAVFIWYLTSKSRAPKEEQTNATHEEVHKEAETVLYGQLVFSKSAPHKSSATVQHAEDPEETVYSQVRVSKAAGSKTPPTEDLYATVNKR
ncbi:B-cell receptor CD22-like [Eucyclogobius newberryi]|uniref:B-cell receptor CD22-like n=1 Tax=Eucyclogobius newberryi TaxID=166745 RepID=UPI003B58DC70